MTSISIVSTDDRLCTNSADSANHRFSIMGQSRPSREENNFQQMGTFYDGFDVENGHFDISRGQFDGPDCRCNSRDGSCAGRDSKSNGNDSRGKPSYHAQKKSGTVNLAFEEESL